MRRRTLGTLTLFALSLFTSIPLTSPASAQPRRPQEVQASPRIKIPPGGEKHEPPIDIGPISPAYPCCGKKPPLKEIPNYSTSTYAQFTGQVAVATNYNNPNSTPSKPAVVIWDLTKQNLSGVPLGTQWSSTSNPATDSYSHPAWTMANLGDVFGLTLDGSGNIYVASTRVYGSANLGSAVVTPGTPGPADIYKLNGMTGSVTRFVQTANAPIYTSGNKIPNTGAGLGNIHFSCDYDKFYVSNFEDGKIYRIDAAGAILNLFDHGQSLQTPIPDTQTNGFTPLGRRPWAVQVFNGRLYYSIWSEDIYRGSTLANEIWSVALDMTGNFTGLPKLEITLPAFSGNFSSPVSDISFSTTGRMLLAERTMTADAGVYAHSSRLLEYTYSSPSWVATPPTKFTVGWYGNQNNAAGGCDYDNSPSGRVWATGDYLNPAMVYGLQGLPSGGGNYQSSILIDLNDAPGTFDKRYIGDVEIPCFQCDGGPPVPVIAPPDASCAKPGQYCVKQAQGVTYTWNVTGGTPATATGSCVNITWGTTSPKAITVTATNAAGCTSVKRLILNDCPPPVDPCCPPFNKDVLKDVLFYSGQGSISAPYTLKFNASNTPLNTQMQNYFNYINSLNPAIGSITIEWSLYDLGVAGTGSGSLVGQVVSMTWNTTTAGTPLVSHPNFFNLPTAHPMLVGNWYKVRTRILLPNGQTFFPEKCINNDMLVRIQVLNAKTRSEQRVLEFSDGQRIIKTVPLTESREQLRR